MGSRLPRPADALLTCSESIVALSLVLMRKRTQDSPRRPGPRLRSSGPFAKVARARGLSLRQLALKAGLNYHTVSTWDQRGQMPPEARRALGLAN